MGTQSAHVSFNSSTKTYTINPGATAGEIQALLNSADSGTTFSFSKGTFTFTESLKIATDGIVIKGEGEGKTIFMMDLDKPGNALEVGGSYGDWTGRISDDAERDDTTVTLTSTSGLKAGDVLLIQQQNTDQFLRDNGYENIIGSSNAEKNPIHESLVEIASISGNEVTLKTPITHDMRAADTTVRTVDMVQDVKLSGFTLTYGFGTPDPDRIANDLPDYIGTISIFMDKTRNAKVENVSVVNAPSDNLEIRTSLSPYVDVFKAQGAFNKGDTGDGYGVHVVETYYGTFQNLDLQDVRHAFVFSSWHTEVGNTVHISATNRDINYHGGPDYNNTVIVDHDVYRSGDTIWRLVSPGGSKHPYTNIDDNVTLFGVAQGGAKQDVVHGWDKGAWLDGGTGNDVLYGGAGDDVILAGKGYDDLYGGGGRDKFAFRPSDGRDDIHDFDPASDVIVIDGFSGVGSFAGVTLKDAGEDTQIIVSGQILATLYGVTAGQLKAQNFAFNQTDLFTPPPRSDNPQPQPEPEPDPGPEPVAGNTYTAISRAENITGTTGDDTISGYSSQITASDVVALGQGVDTLKMRSGSWVFDSKLFRDMSGIDHLDLTDSKAKVILDMGFLQSTDAGQLKISFGEKGLSLLDTSALEAGKHSVEWHDDYVIVKLTGTNPQPQPEPEPEPDPEPEPVAGLVYSLSSKTENIEGTEHDDTVYGYGGQIDLDDVLDMGLGFDTLHSLSSSWTFDSRSYTGFSGIDHLDMTGVKAKITLDNGFMSHTDSGKLTVSYDARGIAMLDTSKIDSGRYEVSLKGTGEGVVTLSAGDDVIRSGKGADTLWLGGGKDTVRYGSVLEGGDVIQDFGLQDRLDLTGLFAKNGLAGKSAVEAAASGHLKTAQHGSDLVVSFDADGHGGHAGSVLATLEDATAANILIQVIVA